jgi:long-subunit fatty acid transport protein
MTASALALGATAATAGGIERSGQSVGILFEQGNYVEFNIGRVRPDVSGTQQITAGQLSPAGVNSGDMAKDYTTMSLGLKMKVNDRIDAALIIDEPVGADVSYPITGYLYGGSTADINSYATTALLRYKFDNNISLIGGLRAVRTNGNVALFNGYTMSTDTQTDFGYVLGVAWEKPEIAARVALTYNSAITHDFNAHEVSLSPAADVMTTFETEIPQSLTLEGQTGVAKDTLVFGSIRWVDWSAFQIAPPLYMDSPANVFKDPLVSYDNDSITYTLGVGRRFNENWSGAMFVSHETGKDGYAGNLGPTDGSTAVGLAATYTRDNLKITGGVRYVMIGDAETETPAALLAGNCPNGDCGTFGKFTDNHAVAIGLRIGYSF